MFQMKLIILFLICTCSSIGAEEIPDCDYFDTVDLTFIEKLTNGSYIYEDVLIPPEQTGTYKYKILFEGTKKTVEDHIRGCVCKIKPCIRYCCHRHRLDLNDESKCTKEFKDDQVNITLEDGTRQERLIRDQFVVQPGINIDCDYNNVGPFGEYYDSKLFENGTLYRSIGNVYLSKRDYCIQPKEMAIEGWELELRFWNCVGYLDFFEVRSAYTFFLLLTTLIHLFVIKQQHVYDKCCLCYLICLSINTLMVHLYDFENFLIGTTCYIVAFSSYFFYFSSYIWLAVMSFEFYRVFVADMFVNSQYNNQSRFLKYSLFVWGTASALLLITILADKLLDNLDIDTNWKVGYAYYNCDLKFSDWSIFVYMLGTDCLITLIQATLIISTIWHVQIENRKNRKQLDELGQHNIKNNIMTTFYLRILITEILNWIIDLCFIIYNIPIIETEYFYDITSYFSLIYVILTFAITVYRRDVRQLFARC